ncbi:OLC1v1001938C2 [Oldenlandia corymbosa var. corymbosa]|uniref:Pectinesterase n=1 Tax=Oldenlandia corymbosa var. corymbosa TaxID=529605 RepID=A0AAV1D6G2_OLDCO|nr:OLC1v1001938C2 [Oldenlandia corymbosa var. corymbosa]
MKNMQSKTCMITLMFLLSFIVSNAFKSPCENTPFPQYCTSALRDSNSNPSSTIHDSGRNSISHSLRMANKFIALVDRYINATTSFPESTLRALQDCYSLAILTRDFLTDTIQTIRYRDNLQTWQADYMLTILSATLTNQQTCMNGLQEVRSASNVRNIFSAPITNGTQSYSVSLALFMHGWGGHKSSGRWLKELSVMKKVVINGGGGRKLLATIPAGVNVSQVVFVNPKPGKGNFTTISDAVAAAPNNTDASNGYYLINIAAGVYQEYVNIPSKKMYIMMIGAGINKTIITGNRSVVDGWTTFNSATFVVTGQGFVAQKITFRNTAGAVKHQAVAVRSGADLSAFYKCSFEGYQDTLYTHSMRQFYKKCDIYGTIDFIFGNAAVVFQSCNIYNRLPMPGQFNTVTAQGRTDINQNTGTSIQNCTVTAAPDLATSNGTTLTYLGRPWQNYSRTIVMQSFLDNVINPAGWTPWSGNQSLDTLYYAEFNNTGPGSVTTNRVNWPGFHLINATDAANYTVSSFIQGKNWLTATRVPFASGLKLQ